MPYTPAARERAMTVREVILKAVGGAMTWIQAAEVLGLSPRTVRRWRYRLRQHGVDGLIDRRQRSPSPRAVPEAKLRQLLRLYRERYAGYNVRHFWSTIRRKHGFRWSYSFVRRVLQEAGLVKKQRPRGCHRTRREPRPCFGELVHLDGSRHRWLTLVPELWLHLIVVLDDATRKILYARFEPSESSFAVMRALRAVLERFGMFMALYTDRAAWAAHTPRKGEPVDKDALTQIGRALKQLGIEHILAYSPQARGRSERINRTLQDRLVNELRVAGVRTPEAANRYLERVFIEAYNEEFGRAPADTASACVPLGAADLDAILCHEEERTVARDNTVTLDRVRLQIAKQPGRATCAGIRVLVRRHLDDRHTVHWGRRCLGRFDGRGRPLQHATPVTSQSRDPEIAAVRAS